MTTKKILSPLELDARVQELERLLKCVNHNLETIQYSCRVDGCMAGQVLAKETREWIDRALA